ncbi:MAG: FAD-dependent oxidoreductase [Myxococcales bacterium]
MTQQHFHVVIVGAGPAGLGAGLFTARYGLRTLLFDCGKSVLKQCAYLDNYLGFPGGIDADQFLASARAHVLEAGCQIARRRVVSVQRAPHGPARFVVTTNTGECALADRVIAASGFVAPYLLGLEAQLVDSEGELRPGAVANHGRTAVEGLYLAGCLSGAESQAMISAGHAAQVALELVRDVRQEGGLWEALARYLDWQVRRGTYDRESWVERVRAYFEPLVRAESEHDRTAFEAQLARWISAKRAQQLDTSEVKQRRGRARELRGAVSPHTASPVQTGLEGS